MAKSKEAKDTLDERDATIHLESAVRQALAAGMTETDARRAAERVIDRVYRG